MSSKNRRPWESATVIDQTLLDYCQDNLLNGMESIIEITAPDGSIIRASDRNKYVGVHFYEALTNFPSVTRTVGDWLGTGLVFSEIDFELSNVDGRFNKFLPGGARFGTWVNRPVVLKIGLSEQAGTYLTVFNGNITNEGGFSRSTKSIKIRARNELEKVNASFPTVVFTNLSHPKANESLWGKHVPVVYGDWTQEVTNGAASLPALVTNGADLMVNGKTAPVTIANGSPAVFTSVRHRLDVGDEIDLETTGSLPSGISTGKKHVIQVLSVDTFTLSNTDGGAELNASGAQSGSHTIGRHNSTPLDNVKLTISINDLVSLDTSRIYLRRGEFYYKIPQDVIVNVGSGNKTFEIDQDSSAFQIDSAHWMYDESDEFFVMAHGKSLSSYSDNPVWIARDIMITYGGLVSGDFNSLWDTFRDKAIISSTKARAYLFEESNAMEYAISLLEQVQLEPFVNRDLKFSLNSLQFDDWVASPNFKLRNWDLEKDSFQLAIDQRNNFNRARAVYNYLPDKADNAWSTGYFRNQAAITQQGSSDTKVIVYPNLYQRDRVEYFAKETLKLASAFREVVTCTVTPRAFLLDISNFLALNIQIGSSRFENVPAMIRDLGYDPANLKLTMSVWAMTMIPFPGWTPGNYGTVGGYNATIVSE